MSKVCSECGESKELDDFGLDHGQLSRRCRNCISIYDCKQAKLSHVKLKRMYSSMISRCCNTDDRYYSRYGGRGISVCAVWYFEEDFVIWATDHGWEPGLQIDRIDNDGDYCPENVRFVTCVENVRNSTSTKLTKEEVAYLKYVLHFIPHNVLAKQFNVNRKTINDIRLGRSWQDIKPSDINPRKGRQDACSNT